TWAILDLVWAVQYYMFDYQVFCLPALLAMTLLIGFGAQALEQAFLGALDQWRLWMEQEGKDPRENVRAARIAGAALIILIFACQVVPRWRENDQHRDWSALRYGRALAQALPRHAVVFAAQDHFWFPLYYEKVVEGSLPDTLFFNLYETPRPESYRLFARFGSRAFAVLPVPGCGAPGRQRSEYDFFHSLVEANIIRRPVVMLVPPDVLNTDEVKEALAGYYRAWHSNLPFVEFYPVPPRFQPQPPTAPPLLSFADGTQLLEFHATYEPDRGVQWVHLQYRWSVAVKAPCEPIQIRTALAA